MLSSLKRVTRAKRACHQSMTGGGHEHFDWKNSPPELHNYLDRYNAQIYVPAKHVFGRVGEKSRFTPKEVVYICFITVHLAESIKKLSKNALLYSQDKLWF